MKYEKSTGSTLPWHWVPGVAPARTSRHAHAASFLSFSWLATASLSWSLLTASGSSSLPGPAAVWCPGPPSALSVSRHTPSCEVKRQDASRRGSGSFCAASASSHITTWAKLQGRRSAALSKRAAAGQSVALGEASSCLRPALGLRTWLYALLMLL